MRYCNKFRMKILFTENEFENHLEEKVDSPFITVDPGKLNKLVKVELFY